MADIISSRTVSLSAGDTSKVVSGVYGSGSYMVIVTPNYPTERSVTNQLSSQFTVNLGTPAPAGGELDCTVVQLS